MGHKFMGKELAKVIRVRGRSGYQQCKHCEQILGYNSMGLKAHYRKEHKELGLSNMEIAKLYGFYHERTTNRE